jgi:hypothetical protein
MTFRKVELLRLVAASPQNASVEIVRFWLARETIAGSSGDVVNAGSIPAEWLPSAGR